MTATIVRAGLEAAEDLAATHQACFPKPWSATAFAELMAPPSATVLAIFGEADVSGFILIRTIEDQAEILTLAVHPQARRIGLARRLVEAAAEAAAADGARTMWLEVGVDNAAALALYAGTGFEAAGRRKAYYQRAGSAEDALILRRVLNTITA